MGVTRLTMFELDKVVEELEAKFQCGMYNIFSWNCNHFSNEMLKMLVGREMPKEYFRLTNGLRYLCCCLPESVVNGQLAFKWMMEDEEEVEGWKK